MELSADYEQEQRALKDRAAALQEELDKSQAATVNAEKFMGIVRKHLAFEEDVSKRQPAYSQQKPLKPLRMCSGLWTLSRRKPRANAGAMNAGRPCTTSNRWPRR